MKLENLSAFIAVVEYQSFTRAAQELYISQPALSRQILDLEQNVGCTLLTREGRTIQMTDAGRIFMVHATRLVKEWDALKKEMALISGKEGAAIRIGYTLSGQLHFILQGMKRWMLDASTTEVSFRRALAHKLLEEIRMGTLDCAVMHLPSIDNASDFTLYPIASCNMNVTVPHEHDLVGQTEVTLSQLSQETDIRCFRAFDPLYYAAVDEAFLQKGLQPMTYVETGEPEECQLMAVGSKYVYLSPSIYSTWEGFVTMPIANWPTSFDLVLVCKKGEDAVLRHFAAAIRCQDSPES